MNTQLQLPPQFALRDALNPLTEALLKQTGIKALYLTEVHQSPRALYNLLIVVQDTAALHDLRKQLPALQVQFPGFLLQGYTVKQVRTGLQGGALYFLRFYRFGELIYTAGPQPERDASPEAQLDALRVKAAKLLDRDTARICAFFDTAAALFEQEQYPAAVLALAEVLKACLNLSSRLFTGEERAYTSMEAQVAALSRYLPQLRVLFPKREANESEPTRLEWLDAWATEGFDPDETLDRHSCYQVQIAMERVFGLVDAAARQLLGACESHHTLVVAQPEDRPQGADRDTPLQGGLQEALLFLQQTYRVHSAYLVFGEKYSRLRQANLFAQQEVREHQSHAVVVLITYKAVGVSPSQLTDRVYNHTGRRIRIRFILETFKQAYKALDFGSNFLQRVIGEGKLLYEEDEQLRKFLKTGCFYYPDKFRKLKKYWDIRLNRAQYLVEITRILDTHEDELVQLHLYHEAFVQTCLGLIRLFWEYSPAYTSLTYLLDLCRTFTGFPQELLETTSFKARRRLYLITHAQQHLRYGTFCKVSYDDCNDSYHLCIRFIEQAEAMAEERLLVLRRKTYQRD
ncbi:hypothetical protein [Leeuwenhoekiella parthenopeia]|uniref:Uncharacterized protein n=1 Tax=Leeuwenhoekiella parthenopeia TaxID=2890320 RepID=A0ABS8GXI8_9FLAO|nr:hypothetical protein [Leeuwenhoekiella parthenopeia]MCC4214724.1 hypothetical protein [Leeuwenhoekiella parthenopeia]